MTAPSQTPSASRRRFLRRAGAGAAAGWSLAAWPRGRAAQPARIRIGQIGVGHAHAAGKIRTLRKLNQLYEVVGVAEPDERLRAAAQKSSAYQGCRWMTVDQLLNTPGLQAVAVETEVKDLVPTAARCIAAGVHVHLDKPAGQSLAAFRKLLEQATRRGLVVQMGYMFRYNPAFQFLFRAVRKGWLGELFEVDGVISKAIGADKRRALAQYPGSMFELGCHLIDALIALLGPPDRVTPFVRRTRPAQDQLADNCLAVFEYARAIATIRSTLVEVEGQRRRQLVACGQEGTVVIEPLEPPAARLALAAPRANFRRGWQDVALPLLEGRYDGDFRDLARIIRGEKEPDFPPAHDLAVHEAVLRASGQPLDPL